MCRWKRGRHHVTQIPPLVQKVSVHIDAVRLGEVFGDEVPYRGEVYRFLVGIILDVAEVVVFGAALGGEGCE
jgi:hypothetical protein